MQVFYYSAPHGNFGDDLNEWLWPKLWPGYREYNRAQWLVGIGSILDGRLNVLPGRKLVIGTGYRPSRLGRPNLETCDIAFVRGPLTSSELELEPRSAIADTAIMVAKYSERTASSRPGTAFMPHVSTAGYFNCTEWADRCGLRYIDPRWTTTKVLASIASADRLMTEAMHGAIVADAIGVPWKRVCAFNTTQDDIESVDFKWRDWATAIGVSAEPAFNCRLPWPGRTWARRRLKRPYVLWREREFLASLSREAESRGFRLSDRPTLARKMSQVEEVISRLQSCGSSEVTTVFTSDGRGTL